jgi:uncharacterized membrane protein
MTKRTVRLPNGTTATVSLLVLPGNGQPPTTETMERVEAAWRYYRVRRKPAIA